MSERTVEGVLARVLSWGTGLSVGMISVGLGWAAISGAGGSGKAMRVVSAGIAVLILLPCVRVALMLGDFVRRRDYRFALLAAIVLGVILAGIGMGVLSE